MRILDSAVFTQHQIPNNTIVTVNVQWRSDTPGDLMLHFEADKFQITPDHIALPVDPAGSKPFDFTISRLTGYVHCDVNFTFGSTNRLDSVDVTP